MAGSIDDKQTGIIKEAVQRFVDAQSQGEQPDIDEFVREYPGLEDQIKQSIQDMQRIDALFGSLVRADESDFEETAVGEDLVGRKVGSFEIVEMIGRGGMGVVYLARDTKLKRSVAIKSLPAELASDSTARTRFRREAELLASLNHPNIAVIYDIVEQDEAAGYLILEYVPGETLAELIARGPLSVEQALSIGRQVAEAVSAAHQKGVVHRDLKPGNIKITPEGKAKVLDFGLAKATVGEGGGGDITATQPGRVVGTPAYMSPEQARGKSTDHRTDIWSFGCIMYQTLTGRLPFEGETATDTLARIIERDPDWDLLPDTTPANIRDLLRRCLEKDQARRLETIADTSVVISKTLARLASTSVEIIPIKSRSLTMVISAIVIVVLTGAAIWFGLNWNSKSSTEVIRLVVLPFENLGSENDEDYSNVISAEIISRLVGIQGLAVSSGEIAENRAMLLGKKSGVDYVLKGTLHCVQLSDPNSQVMRIRPQLIRISDGQYVWAEPYDKDMSQIYEIPSELAERVARAMDITLLESERQAIGSLPTENEEAYTYYLRGNDYLHRSYRPSDYQLAIRMYEKAIELDPTFALAYSQLSRSHLLMIWWYADRSEERLAIAKQAVDKALQLNPDLPEVHLALGHYYYHGLLDYDRALDEFAIAQKSQPNNSDLLSYIGYVQRRQGKFEEGLANIKRAFELNPISSPLARSIGETCLLLRRYPDAEYYLTLAIELAPELTGNYILQARLYLSWQGSIEKARAALHEGLKYTKAITTDAHLWLVTLAVYDENYQEALDHISSISEDIEHMFFFRPNALRSAQIYRSMNQVEQAKKYYNEARIVLESKIREQPEDARYHSSLGIAYAGLGQEEDAIREGKLGIEYLPVSKEAYRGVYRVEDLARIYVMVGDSDNAIDQIEFLLSRPGDMSIPLLRLDPAWDPLRNHPRFKKLVDAGQ